MKKDITFKSKDNLTNIHAAIWIPDKEPIGIIQISHGMNEHINRYEKVANYFNGFGYIVCGHDHLGHGASTTEPKKLGYFADKDSKNILIEDLHYLTNYIKQEYPNLPITLLGYSFGSLIARNYLPKYSSEIDGLILIGSPVHGKPKLIFGQIAATVISLFKQDKYYRSPYLENKTTGSFKKYYKSNNKVVWLSKDQDYLNEYLSDPLVKFRFTTNGYKTMFNLIQTAEKNYKLIENKNLPILILGGKDDPVTHMGKDPQLLNQTLTKKGLTNVKFKIYNGLRHSLLNEVEKSIVLNDILFFVNKLNKKED